MIGCFPNCWSSVQIPQNEMLSLYPSMTKRELRIGHSKFLKIKPVSQREENEEAGIGP